jgi:hypothetical protein
VTPTVVNSPRMLQMAMDLASASAARWLVEMFSTSSLTLTWGDHGSAMIPTAAESSKDDCENF